MSEPTDKITDAAETCLAFAAGKSNQFVRVSAYLKSLQDDGDWTDAEIVEVQIRVIRALMLKRIEAEE